MSPNFTLLFVQYGGVIWPTAASFPVLLSAVPNATRSLPVLGSRLCMGA